MVIYGADNLTAPPYNDHADRGAVCLHTGGVNHHSFRLVVFGGRAGHPPGEDTFVALTIVSRLVRRMGEEGFVSY